MSILNTALLSVMVVSLIHPLSAFAQTEERVIFASVIDETGAPVTALTTTDFIVREDRIPREVLRVAPAAGALQIAVVIDTSQVMEPHVNDLRRALKEFFTAMAGKHELALMEFGERPTILVEYTRDPARLGAGVDRVFARTGSGAYLLDALVEVSRGLRKREGTRAAIVAITAEGPEFSERYHQAVLDELRGTDASLHALVLTRPRASVLSRAAQEREITLADGARLTGGHRDILLTSMALGPTLRALAARLQNQYEVVYARPASLLSPDELEVSVKRPELIVRAPRAPRRSPTAARN
jgi:Ca-activated chloride channel family protein